MRDIAPEVVSIADACLGGLQGRSALLIGSEHQLSPYIHLLRQAQMKVIYCEDTSVRIPSLLPEVQLLISMDTPDMLNKAPRLTAADIAKGYDGRRTPLVIFDLAANPSVEELAGLLPEVCLYTPGDIRTLIENITPLAS